MGRVTPMRLFEAQAAVVLGLAPGLTNGDSTSVHDARVATRRLRELLPLTVEWQGSAAVEELTKRVSRLGRELGRVRDEDVQGALLRRVVARAPAAAAPISLLLQDTERKRLSRLRRLIKHIERDGLVDRLCVATALSSRWRWHVREPHAWRRRLTQMLAGRAAEAREAIEHATGVYFPRRTHQARIALKKLRYTLENAALAAGRDAKHELRLLQKAQRVLGDLRDRQELLDRLAASSTVPGEGAQVMVQMLEAECRDLHGLYAAQRPELLDACRGMAAGAPRVWPTVLAALAASAGVYASARVTRQLTVMAGERRA